MQYEEQHRHGPHPGIAPDKSELRFALAMALGLVLWVACHVHFLEGWAWVDSFYFAASTLSTVGYGDLTPEHTVTKILVTIDMIFSVGIFVYATSLLTRYRFASSEAMFLSRIRRWFSTEEKKLEAAVETAVAEGPGVDKKQDEAR